MKKFILFLSIVFLGFFGISRFTSAATLYLNLGQENFNIGDQFSLNVGIDSQEALINAAQVTLQFPTDILQVIGLDKSNSIFDFWLTGPSFSNETGQVIFIGGSNNGLSGKSLQALKVNFIVKGSGEANLILTDGAVTASDGSGTNVLSTMQGAQITVSSKTGKLIIVPTPQSSMPTITPPQQIIRPAIPATKLPITPLIEVPLYPDQTKWHNVSSKFLVRWNLPTDITDVATTLNKKANFDPSVSEGLFDNKIFGALDDGIWYLHVRFKNNQGWGLTAHYCLTIDTVPPALNDVNISEGLSTDNPAPTLNYKAADSLSGIDRYFTQIDNGDLVDFNQNPYVLSLLKPGKHLVKIRVQDKAKNAAETALTLEILPIVSPIVGFLTSDILLGEGGITMRGTASPNNNILFSLNSQNNQALYSSNVLVDQSGNWAVTINQPLKKGKYYFEVTAQDERGALSLPVKTNFIRVHEKPILTLGKLEVGQFWFFMSLIIILLFGFAGGWYFQRLAKQQRGRKAFVAQHDVISICDMIDKDLNKISENLQVKKNDEKGLSETEFYVKRVKENIKKNKRYLLENIKEVSD